MAVFIPVELQLPRPSVQVFLKLNKGQKVASKSAIKQLRHLLSSNFGGVNINDVTFTCNDGTSLPDMPAAEYATRYGTICARGSDRFLQLLQQQVSTLRSEMRERKEREEQIERRISDLQQQLHEIRERETERDKQWVGRSQLLEEQRKYRKILRRDIVVRARDLLSQEGGQPAGVSFSKFSTGLSDAFLQQRNLTEGAISIIIGTTISVGDAVAHRSSPEELRRGLDGLSGVKLDCMKMLYDYVIKRQQQQQ